MAKLIEFDNILEFKKYVSQLKNEDILSFSYKDWVLLFESIERLNKKLLNEEDFEELKKVFSKGENVDNIENGEFFANYICPDEFSKLYANFYLKTDDWRISKNIAQEIAKELYEKKVDLANVLVNINAKISMVEKTDRAALKTTKYHYLYDDALEVMKSKTLVFEKVDDPSSGTTCYKTLNTEIKNSRKSTVLFYL
jgi:Fe-S cluster biosynthesis and repair protein YggX